MRSLVGPIFWIELITSSRRARYFLLRAVYAAVLLFVFWTVYANHTRFLGRPSDIGTIAQITAAFFAGFSFVQLVAVLLIGPAMVAGAIATERERRTIEYLFAASLSNAQIVVGKLAARVLQIVFLLLTGLPILAIAMLLGGIAPEALAVVYAVTACTVLFVSTLAMAISVWTPRARDAVVRVYLALIVLLIVPSVTRLLILSNPALGDLGLIGAVNEWLIWANPLWVLGTALNLASGSAPAVAWEHVAWMAAIQGVLSAALLAGSIVTLRWAHLRRQGKADRPRRFRFQLWRPTIGDRPMLWKELFAASAGSRLGWLGRLLILILLTCVYTFLVWQFFQVLGSARNWETESFLWMIVIFSLILCCGALLLIAARAAGSITSEKERDSWTSLLSTPLSAREIVWAKVLGSLWDVRHVVWLLAGLWALGIPLRDRFWLGALGSVLVFVVLAFFVASLGTFFSLLARTSLRAMGATLGLLVFLGGGYFFCCVPLMMLGNNGRSEEFACAPCLVFLQIFPGVVCIESHTPGDIVGAFVLGMIGYLIAGPVFFTLTVEMFDRRSGRGGWGGEFSGLPTRLTARPRVPGEDRDEDNVDVDDLIQNAKPPRIHPPLPLSDPPDLPNPMV